MSISLESLQDRLEALKVLSHLRGVVWLLAALGGHDKVPEVREHLDKTNTLLDEMMTRLESETAKASK